VNAVDPSGEYSEYSLSGMTMAASVAGIIAGIGQYNYSRTVLHASAWDSICSSLVSAAMAFFAVYYAPLIFAKLMAGSLIAVAFASAGMAGLLLEGAELLGQFFSEQYTPMQKVAIVGKFLSIIMTGYLAGISVRYGTDPSFGITIRSSQGEVGVGVDAARGSLNPASTGAAAKSVPDGKFYSVAYEMKLNPKSYPGKSSYIHFKEANLSLEGATKANPGLADLGISVPRSSAGSVTGKSPSGWVWHHDVEAGTMQLVPKAQHPNIPGGIFWNTLHPGGMGGMSIWGGGH